MSSETGIYDGDAGPGRGYVRMANGSRPPLRIVGSYPPVRGDRVRLTVSGSDTVIDGVAAPKATAGNVTVVGTMADGHGGYIPAANVRLSDGTDANGLRYLDHISGLRVGDAVVVDWPAGGLIIGRFPTVLGDAVAPDNGTGRLTQIVRAAAWAGRYYLGAFTTGGPACTTNNAALWGGYGLSPVDMAQVTRIEMFLPPDSGGINYSAAMIGTHTTASQPGAFPAVADRVQMTGRTGWAVLRDDTAGINPGWGVALSSGGGIAIPAHAGTEDYWKSLTADPASGSLRLIMRS